MSRQFFFRSPNPKPPKSPKGGLFQRTKPIPIPTSQREGATTTQSPFKTVILNNIFHLAVIVKVRAKFCEGIVGSYLGRANTLQKIVFLFKYYEKQNH